MYIQLLFNAQTCEFTQQIIAIVLIHLINNNYSNCSNNCINWYNTNMSSTMNTRKIS